MEAIAEVETDVQTVAPATPFGLIEVDPSTYYLRHQVGLDLPYT